MITAYLIVRLWHGRLAAWITVALLSFSYWPLSASRFGYRLISLAFVLGLAILLFWHAWQNKHNRWWQFTPAGICLGLAMYTYQPARFVPFIFLAFTLYIVIFHRQQFVTRWRSLLVALVAFLLIMLPLVFTLSRNGALELEQRAFVVEPITQLLAGDPQLLWSNTLATVKAFMISGDPLKSYNIPGRPIFVPVWTGMFFIAGLLLALWRWRKPIYAFVLLWLFFTLLPTVFTISAPNFNRMVAAQVPVMFLAAFPLAELLQRAYRSDRHWVFALSVIVLAISLLAIAIGTWRDYFEVWPVQYGDVHTFNREVAAVAHYLENNPDNMPVVVSSRNIEDDDPYIVSVSMDREDLRISWVDASQAMVMPFGADKIRLIVTKNSLIDNEFLSIAELQTEPFHQESDFSIYYLSDGDWTEGKIENTESIIAKAHKPFGEGSKPIDWFQPYTFCDCEPGTTGSGSLILKGITIKDESEARDELVVITAWETLQDTSFTSLATFTHLVDSSYEIVTQYDGLGYPPHTWRSGDRFIQISRLPSVDQLHPGDYWLQLGLYERESGQRWLLLKPNNEPLIDRLLFGPITVTEEGKLLFENGGQSVSIYP